MMIWLIAIIALSLVLMISLAYASWMTYLWWQYAFNTPAPEFLNARKRGSMIAVQFHQTGAARFIASEEKEEFKHKTTLVHTAPYSTFLEPKSKLLMTCSFVSPGLSGKTISPEFTTFTDEVERRLQEEEEKDDDGEKKSRKNIVQEIEEEQKNNGQVQTVYGPVSFAHVQDYLNYSDATANYNSAQKLAAVLNKGGMGDLLKTIVYIVLALAAFGAFLGMVFLFYKMFFTQPVEVTVDAAKNAAGTAGQAAVNATKAAAQNATTMKP